MNDDNIVLDPAHSDDLPQVAGMAPDTKLPGQMTDAEWKASDDGNIVSHGERKYVPQEALHAERQRAQQLSATLAKIEPLVPELAELLQQKANRNNANVERTTRQPNDTYADDDDLRGLAIVRGYYLQDGVTPDTARANQELNIMARVADRSAQRHVGPVQQDTIRSHADANYRTASARRFADGEPIADQKYIDQVFQNVPPDQRADPAVAQMLEIVAVGMQALDDRKAGRSRGPRREPDFREGQSGRRFGSNAASLDAFSAAAAKARGMTGEQWSKLEKDLTGGSRMGTGTILEEI